MTFNKESKTYLPYMYFFLGGRGARASDFFYRAFKSKKNFFFRFFFFFFGGGDGGRGWGWQGRGGGG